MTSSVQLVSAPMPEQNEESNIVHTVAPVIFQEIRPTIEIIVTDEGSSGRTYVLSRRYTDEHLQIRTLQNDGIARGTFAAA